MSTSAFGATRRLSTETRDADGNLFAPGAISLTILLPDGTTAGPLTPVNDGVGLYHYDYTPTQAGRHIARWATTSPTGADEETFDVAAQWAEAGVISLAEAKAQLNITGNDDDDEIAGMVRAVTAVCERHVGALARTTYAETHSGGYRLVLNHAPVTSVASVTPILNSGVDQTVADLDVDGPTGIIRRIDGAYMCGPFHVTYTAGRAEMPANVRLAALIILQHLWETQRGQQGGVSFGGSGEVYDPRWGYAIPRRALELLGDQIPGIA